MSIMAPARLNLSPRSATYGSSSPASRLLPTCKRPLTGHVSCLVFPFKDVDEISFADEMDEDSDVDDDGNKDADEDADADAGGETEEDAGVFKESEHISPPNRESGHVALR